MAGSLGGPHGPQGPQHQLIPLLVTPQIAKALTVHAGTPLAAGARKAATAHPDLQALLRALPQSSTGGV